MRDFSRGTAWLSINQATTRAAMDAGAGDRRLRAPWRAGHRRLARQARRMRRQDGRGALKAAGMTVTGLCRGGMFPAADKAGRQAAIDENKRAVDEAAAIGAQCLVLIAGGLARGSKDIAGARGQVRDGIAALLPYARAAKRAARHRAAAPDVRGRPRLPEHDGPGQRPLRRAGRRAGHCGRRLSRLVGPEPGARDPPRRQGADPRPSMSATGWCRPPTCCSTAA